MSGKCLKGYKVEANLILAFVGFHEVGRMFLVTAWTQKQGHREWMGTVCEPWDMYWDIEWRLRPGSCGLAARVLVAYFSPYTHEFYMQIIFSH